MTRELVFRGIGSSTDGANRLKALGTEIVTERPSQLGLHLGEDSRSSASM